jgi:hypothetical protein
MGHYDDCYEADTERQREQDRKEAIRFWAEVEPLFDELDTKIRQHFFQPHPLKNAMRELEKELLMWQHNERLVIQDPNIIIDILKGDK